MDRGPAVTTATGKAFYPFDPRAEEVEIQHIAASLSTRARFTGSTRQFYSVAQHSALVADYMERPHRLWGLLHDAAEAYLPDVVSQMKPRTYLEDLDGSLVKFKTIEKRIMRAVCQHFGLPEEEPAGLKKVDVSVLLAEARDMLPTREVGWWPDGDPIQEFVYPLGPRASKILFLSRYYEILNERKSFLRVPLVEVKR